MIGLRASRRLRALVATIHFGAAAMFLLAPMELAVSAGGLVLLALSLRGALRAVAACGELQLVLAERLAVRVAASGEDFAVISSRALGSALWISWHQGGRAPRAMMLLPDSLVEERLWSRLGVWARHRLAPPDAR